MKKQQENFLCFDIEKDGVYAYLQNTLVAKPSTYGNSTKIVKMLLTLLRGQVQAERGFSVNNQMVVVNLNKESLIAQRNVQQIY